MAEKSSRTAIAAGLQRASAPPFRRLWVFTFDPATANAFETSALETVVLRVPWETNAAAGEPLPDRWSHLTGPERMLGPVGEYLEVVDLDPGSHRFYRPIDLNDTHLLAQDGLAPSETDPQFHQQMVYAVAMTTIGHFEAALGRKPFWHGHRRPETDGEVRARIERTRAAHPKAEIGRVTAALIERGRGTTLAFVPRLRIYPHALRQANAYYSRNKHALLFGYFPAQSDSRQPLVAPGSTVFTCLSYDVVAHETTHALLDGLHRRYLEPTNPDVLAFHEGFADLVAIFQHFSHPEALRQAINDTQGHLRSQNRLAELATGMGHALGKRGALRDAIGGPPDATAIDRTSEPHERGSILVAAVFDAFHKIYCSRAEDLVRIASG